MIECNMMQNVQIYPKGQFADIIAIIDKAYVRTFQAVNRELINMYWSIGQ